VKVLVINGSPHGEGTTYGGICIAKKELEEQGIEVEVVHIGDKLIRGCMNCGGCIKLNQRRCIYDDDIVNRCIEKMETSDGLILASPVYYSGINGTMKCFCDRFFYAAAPLQYKAAAAIIALRRSGGVPAYNQLNNYLELANAVLVPSKYWNVIHGRNAEEIQEDLEGVQIMQTIGRNMAWLLQVLENSKGVVEKPKLGARIRTNFVR
jgi:multimeric flavodoxin WrbA